MTLDRFEVVDPDFQVRSVDTLLPTNNLWKDQRGSLMHIGLLMEIQTVACRTNMTHLARYWWPLTAATISRSLNVSSHDFLNNLNHASILRLCLVSRL